MNRPQGHGSHWGYPVGSGRDGSQLCTRQDMLALPSILAGPWGVGTAVCSAVIYSWCPLLTFASRGQWLQAVIM